MNPSVQELARELERIKALNAREAYDEALALTRQLLERHPGCAALWLMGGRLLHLARADTSPLESIGQYFENARALAPTDPEPEMELGYYLYAVRDQTAAGEERFVEAARKARIHLRDALLGQLKCAAERGDRDACQQVLQEAAASFPGDSEFEALGESLE